MSLFSMFGWPDCAKSGCPNPGLVKVELDGPAGPIWAHLCITCLADMQKCLVSLEEVQKKAETADESIPPKDPDAPAGYLESA